MQVDLISKEEDNNPPLENSSKINDKRPPSITVEKPK